MPETKTVEATFSQLNEILVVMIKRYFILLVCHYIFLY